MDGDGRPDIVMPNMILYNEGNFNFTLVQLNFGTADASFVIGDFNHDGLPDIATGGSTLLNSGNRTFTTVQSNNLDLVDGLYAVSGDLNGDGNADIVMCGNGDPVIVYYSRGDGTFYVETELNVGPTDPQDFSQAMAIQDFNGDGRPDILACLFLSGVCALYTNDGQGGFEISYFASGTNTMALLATDLDGDGKPDLAITNYKVDFEPPSFVVIFNQ